MFPLSSSYCIVWLKVNPIDSSFKSQNHSENQYLLLNDLVNPQMLSNKKYFQTFHHLTSPFKTNPSLIGGLRLHEIRTIPPGCYYFVTIYRWGCNAPWNQSHTFHQVMMFLITDQHSHSLSLLLSTQYENTMTNSFFPISRQNSINPFLRQPRHLGYVL